MFKRIASGPEKLRYRLCAVGLLLVACTVAGAQAAARAEALALDARTPVSGSAVSEPRHPTVHHAQSHAHIAASLAQQEAQCYQQFAVNRCLSVVREQARTERAALDKQEHLENSAARREAGEVHRRAREQRIAGREFDAARTADSVPGTADTTVRAAAKPAKAGANADLGQIRQQRAAAQAQRDERALRARQRLADKRAAAQRRQASIERRSKDRTAQGKPRAAPLPVSPAPL